MNIQARHLYSYEYRTIPFILYLVRFCSSKSCKKYRTIPVPSTVRMVRWAWWDGGLLRPPHVLMHMRPPTSCAAAELYLYANMHRTYRTSTTTRICGARAVSKLKRQDEYYRTMSTVGRCCFYCVWPRKSERRQIPSYEYEYSYRLQSTSDQSSQIEAQTTQRRPSIQVSRVLSARTAACCWCCAHC